MVMRDAEGGISARASMNQLDCLSVIVLDGVR